MLINWFKTGILMAAIMALFGVLGGIARLFSTHPPTEERIARLRAMV